VLRRQRRAVGFVVLEVEERLVPRGDWQRVRIEIETVREQGMTGGLRWVVVGRMRSSLVDLQDSLN